MNHIRLNLLAMLMWAAASPLTAQGVAELDDLRGRALELTNVARSEAGLSELKLDQTLVAAAQGHADAMLERDFYAHVTPSGETPRDRFSSAGGSRWALSGENIAHCSGCETPPDAARITAFHDGWMQSPEHRQNILAEGFDSFGFGISGTGGELYAVQTFSGPGAPGSDGTAGEDLSAQEARDLALKELNGRRTAAGLDPFEPSRDLDRVAGRALERRLKGEALPENLFGLLPEGASGWTSLSMQSVSKGGSGTHVTASGIRMVVERLADAEDGEIGSSPRASHLGFATAATPNGRFEAIAAFGGRN